jgi:hypothetical protein
VPSHWKCLDVTERRAHIDDAEDVVIVGPIGTGKTIALGVEAARRRTRVVFTRVADLVRELVEARDDRQLARLHRRYQRVPLLILDELSEVKGAKGSRSPPALPVLPCTTTPARHAPPRCGRDPDSRRGDSRASTCALGAGPLSGASEASGAEGSRTLGL